ncbi:adenylyltransferase/cytidyltransferase family protein [Sulfuriroseicoccus oceanibius]|uniref:Adenylyltransferase/cytidyltransferase family protein n=1 Tax=Sulfuriroseicoccus oceanibius TaxID=2707525 RepID=A0A6B3L958_9BACT|nr:adenylyltransferase/cytidyltransferase family protein [Sulfuriroseicoccus oceanibius]QQL44303.1 adenylyltransferase/cytidyltransferase family protein [Sulfuriroseicoccus oceanibius]
MKRIFVSGCYDILHAGHLQFFEEARALGDHLTVSFASEEVLWHHKQRRSSIPDEHKKVVLEGLRMIDEVIVGSDHDLGLDFKSWFLEAKPDMLVVTEDDQYEDVKRALCAEVGATYHVLPKTPPRFAPVSTSGIVKWVKAPTESPLRVDFAGGWLDVPRYAREGAYVVNCAISPMVSLRDWGYRKRSGLGGSGAWALLNGEDGVTGELALGVGWQDPAVIRETGVCVWRSGQRPVLDFKRNGEMLKGRMALLWTGHEHDTPGVADQERDYAAIERAAAVARQAVLDESIEQLAEAVSLSYAVQLGEGMEELGEVDGAIASKYCGGGHGGYALYLFTSRAARDAAVTDTGDAMIAIEPYCR